MTDIFECLDFKPLQAPFGYIGSKAKSAQHIAGLLPDCKIYVEPFAGTASVLLARPRVNNEVINDISGGIVSFYRALRDNPQELITRLQDSVYARDEFTYCKETWKSVSGVEKAARWYYTIVYSFNGMGKAFGRTTKSAYSMGFKIDNAIKYFPALSSRLRGVLIENSDFEQCIKDFDTPDTLFYIDPPYVDAYRGTYEDELTRTRHAELIHLIQNIKGKVAVSGYHNTLYDDQEWSRVHEWEVLIRARSVAYSEKNGKAALEGHEDNQRGTTTEVLWIRE